jgi:tetratricopeptide (TPR) repeat protein
MDNRYSNKSILNSVKKITPVLIGIIFLNTNVQAQPTRTGTNLNSKAMPSTILMLQAPDEVETMRVLLKDGKKNDALIAAEKYLEEIQRTTLPHQSEKKYYAWNAYCTVLTSLGRVDEAIAACSIAMEFEPEKWSAINNRGTAYFVGHMWLEAMLDYQAALTLVDENNNSVRETIQHNISLTEQRQ